MESNMNFRIATFLDRQPPAADGRRMCGATATSHTDSARDARPCS